MGSRSCAQRLAGGVLYAHIQDKNNPHEVTAAQVGAVTAVIAGNGVLVDSSNPRTPIVSSSYYASAGCLTTPTYTDNGSGSITVGALDVVLYNNANFVGVPAKYTLASITVTLTDYVTNYIVGDYNSGSPILRVVTDVSLINEADVIPVFTIFRSGSILHVVGWDTLANGLANKDNIAVVKTQRYRRETGLGLSVDSSRYATVGSGAVWIGSNRIALTEVASGTDGYIFCYHSGGNWTYNFSANALNNTQYDNGTNLVTLTSNRYAVNFVYRGVESQKHVYVVMGTGDYTATQALSAQPPSIPALISSHAVLVGRVIYVKDSSTAYDVSSAFSTTFTPQGVSTHNDLASLQGGTTNEYYHLTQAQYNAISAGTPLVLLQKTSLTAGTTSIVVTNSVLTGYKTYLARFIGVRFGAAGVTRGLMEVAYRKASDGTYPSNNYMAYTLTGYNTLDTTLVTISSTGTTKALLPGRYADRFDADVLIQGFGVNVSPGGENCNVISLNIETYLQNAFVSAPKYNERMVGVAQNKDYLSTNGYFDAIKFTVSSPVQGIYDGTFEIWGVS